MIPWIADALEGPHSYLFTGQAQPLFNLITLLWDIEQNDRDKERLMLVEPPRSVVYHGFGEAWYLFRQKSRVHFASFAVQRGLASVGFRYNEPTDPGSGRRKSSRLLTGWQGTAELICSAVRRSPVWKQPQTIEVEAWDSSHGNDGRSYEVWAKARCTRTVFWEASESYRSGSVTFQKNREYLLASIDVVREMVDDTFLTENVISISLYPELRGHLMSASLADYDNRNWQPYPYRPVERSCLPEPLFVDMSEASVLRLAPHDELQLNVTWS